MYEGGIRVPFIVRWPGVVKAGTKTDHVSAFWDLLPTIAEIIGTDPGVTDGISFLPVLTGKGLQTEHDCLYWEFHEAGGRQAIRKGDWKAVRYKVSENGRIQLFNLAEDLGEEHDLSTEHPELVKEFRELFETSRTESEVFNFVLPTYNGDK